MKTLLFVVVTLMSVALSAHQACAQLIISEFRLQGPNGANDEFIEIYNNSGADHTVAASDASAGYALVASDGQVRGTIPNGTVIPNRGHYLIVNSVGYSLASYPAGNGTTATGDATYTSDIPLNAGIALFNTANPANFTLANPMDAVGSTTEANTLYKEGAGYPGLSTQGNIANVDHSLVRRLPGGCTGSAGSGDCTTVALIETTPDAADGAPQDTNNNAVDFIFVDTNGTAAGAGQRLGAPGPENLSSPIQRNGSLTITPIDSTQCATCPPNLVRDQTPDGANNSLYGTLDIRRKITNNTGANVTRLRFRVVDITTFPSIGGVADLRPRTSTAAVVTVSNSGYFGSGTGTTNITVQGTTLEQPPSQPNGGGYNSTLSAGTITLATPLAPTDDPGTPTVLENVINVRFLLGLQQKGTFRFAVNVEVLP